MGTGVSGQDSSHSTPQVEAKVLIDPSHPEAGKGGVVPPVHARFREGQSGNPGGRPKGALPRSAWLRKIARDEDEDGIGLGARKIGERVAELTDKLAEDGADVDRISAELKVLLELFAQAEGRPQERVEHSGEVASKVIIEGIDL